MTDCFLAPDRLAAYADGSLPPADRAGVEQHLTGCARCRAELEWLLSLAKQTAALPRAVEPGRDLWSGIEARLSNAAPNRAIRVRWPVLAAAAVALMVISSAITIGWLRKGTITPMANSGHVPVQLAAGTDPQALALATLIGRVQSLEASLPPGTRALVSTQLAEIDAAIEESKAALAGGKASDAVSHMLAARYQQRLDLLQQAERVARKS